MARGVVLKLSNISSPAAAQTRNFCPFARRARIHRRLPRH
jgi:hypothetical protein